MFLIEVLFEQAPAQVPPVQIIQHVNHGPSESTPEPKSPTTTQQAKTEVPPAQQSVSAAQEQPGDQENVEEVPDDELGDGQAQEEQFPPDILPIKKYYLIGQLKELKTQLSEYSLQNDELDTVLKFADNLSYSSLLNVGTALTDVIAQQIARLSDGKNSD